VVLSRAELWARFCIPEAKGSYFGEGEQYAGTSMPAELAENTTRPAPTLAEPHVQAMREAPLKAQQPTEEEVEIAEVFLVAAPLPEPDTQALPDKLPTTATALPLIGLAGTICLGLGGLLKFVLAKQASRSNSRV
jgi:hypothetical protein